MTKDLIKHSNIKIAESREFVTLPNALNEKQLQLLLLLVAQVKEGDTEYNWIHIKYDDLIEMYNKNVYDKKSIKSMKDMILDVVGKKWEIETDTGRKLFGHYIERGMFDDVNRTIDLKLSNETIDFFLRENGNLYSTYKYIKQLHTKCAIQLYRFCNLKKNLGNAIPISIEDAIKLFYDKDKTIKVNDFFRFHLEPALERINCLTDLHVEYEKVKADKDNKRKISSLKFTIYERDKYEKDIFNEDCMIEDFEDCEIDYDFFDDL